MGDLSSWRAEHGRIASGDERDDANEGGQEAHALHPIVVDQAYDVLLLAVVGLIGHVEEGKDGREGTQREPQPSSICWPDICMKVV